jgi:hypothetical protein
LAARNRYGGGNPKSEAQNPSQLRKKSLTPRRQGAKEEKIERQEKEEKACGGYNPPFVFFLPSCLPLRLGALA